MPTTSRPLALMALVAVLSMVIPLAVMSSLDSAGIGALAGTAAFGAVLASAGLGLRFALVTGVLVSLMALAAGLAAGHVVACIAVMVSASAMFAATAHYGANKALVLMPITLAFVINQPPTSAPAQLDPALALGLVTLLATTLASLAAAAVRGSTAAPKRAAGVSTSRTVSFGVLLALVTVCTTAISIHGGWGHAGGWMVMTPFIVMQPFVQEGWRKALRRLAGTAAGFVIAIAFAALIPDSWLLVVVGVAFTVAAVHAFLKHWDYGIYAMFLTPAVVLIESLGSHVDQTALQRLEATLIGGGIALAVMAVSIPLYRRGAREHSLTHY